MRPLGCSPRSNLTHCCPALSSPTSIKSAPVRSQSLLKTPHKQNDKVKTVHTEPKRVKKVNQNETGFKIYADENIAVPKTSSSQPDGAQQALRDLTNVSAGKPIRTPQSRIPLRKEQRKIHTPTPLKNVLSPKPAKATDIVDDLVSRAREMQVDAAAKRADRVDAKSNQNPQRPPPIQQQDKPGEATTADGEDLPANKKGGLEESTFEQRAEHSARKEKVKNNRAVATLIKLFETGPTHSLQASDQHEVKQASKPARSDSLDPHPTALASSFVEALSHDNVSCASSFGR